jgi:hypothetical protein
MYRPIRGRLAAVGPHRADVTYACRRHCWLWPAICPALLPGSCTRGAGAGLVWWRRARAVPTPGLSSHLAARLRFPQAVWVPVPPPNISVRLHTEAVGGQGTGRLERLTPRDNRSGSTQTVPAAALFVLIGASPRTR